MNRLIKVGISAVLAQVLFISALNAQEIIFTDSFETCPPVNRVDWDGGGDGVKWSDPLNWKGNVLPIGNDSVSIRATGQVTLVYDSSAGITNIRCIDSSESLNVTGGELGVETGWVSPGVSITGGTLTVGGNLRVAGKLDLSSGILDGTGTVTVAGLFTWSGGNQQGTGETVANGGMLSSGATRFLIARTLTLNAASTIGGINALGFWDAATINNNAPLEFQSDVDISHYAGAYSTFNNYSTLTKSGGSDVSLIQAIFNNDGTVTVDSGELHVGNRYATGTSSGNYIVALGATLGVSGALVMNGMFTGAGSFRHHDGGTTEINGMYMLGGTLEVSSGGSNTLRFATPVTFSDDVTVSSGKLEYTQNPTAINADVIMSAGTIVASTDMSVAGTWTQSDGILDGTGTVTVEGLFTWSGGFQQGAGQTVANGGMISSGATRVLMARTLTLNAASTIGGTSPQKFWNAATLNNNAPLDIQSDVNMTHHTGAVSTFNNFSTLTKSGGSDVSSIGAAFKNNGGTVSVSSGALAFTKTFLQTSSGTLNIHIPGEFDFDVFAVTGSATLGGTANIIRDGYAPPSATTFDIMTCNNCGGAFATVNGNGVTFTQSLEDAFKVVRLTAD